MKRLPLYPDGRMAEVERTDSEECPEDCTKCSLGGGGNLVSPVGEPGGVLVVGEAPLLGESQAGAPPFHMGAGVRIIKTIQQYSTQPLAADYALKCPTGRQRITTTHSNACRPHLAATLEEVQPSLILCFGPLAAAGVLGRSVSAMKVGTCVDWLSDGTPVFTFPRPADIVQNKFRRAQFKEELEEIFTNELPLPPPISEFVLIEAFDVEQTESICDDLRKREWFAFDTETDGVMWTNYFQINTLAVCVKGKRTPVVWGEQALRNPQIRNRLQALMHDARARKVAHNLKFDVHASNNFFGEGFEGFGMCTLLAARLIDADSAGDLESLAEKVGMGGHKLEAKAALSKARKPVTEVQKGQRVPENAREVQILHYGTRHADSWAYGYLPEDVRNRYCALDTLACCLLAERFEDELTDERKTHWDKLVSTTTEAVCQVESWGIQIAGEHLRHYRSELTKQMEEQEKKIRHALEQLCWGSQDLAHAVGRLLPDGYNPGSTQQTATLLYDALGFEPGKTTAGGAPSVDRESLEKIVARSGYEAALVRSILEWRKTQKLKSTYTEGMSQHIRGDGRIHPSLNIAGTRTGRLSCIAGHCLVKTKRGDVPIKDVRVGDYVWTHRERWRRVEASFCQGIRPVVHMGMSDGNILTCTDDHLLLEYGGSWRQAKDFYASQQIVGAQPGEPESGTFPLQVAGEPDDHRNRQAVGYPAAECAGGAGAVLGAARVQGVEGAQILQEQAGQQESHARQVGHVSPQLERRVRGRQGLPNDQGRWQKAVRPQRGDDGAPGDHVLAERHGGAPHRRRQEEQRAGQPSAGHSEGASQDPLLAGEGQQSYFVTQVQAGGSVAVYDLTVEEDSSFTVHGYFVHNCRSPNLQNIPRAKGSPDAKHARNIFCAPDGYVLMDADYSQLELRVAAGLSGDAKMKAIFDEGVDYHRRTAELISQIAWKIKPEEVQDHHRSAAKTVNFGLLYGQGIPMLAAGIGCTNRMAENIQSAILGEFSDLAKWIQEQLRTARVSGGCWTYWEGVRARWRPLINIVSEDKKLAGTAERSSWNTPIQGSASDYCLASLVECVDWLKADCVPAQLVLTVHDSLVFQVSEDAIEEAAEGVKAIMGSKTCNGVPLDVDVAIGKSWGEMSEWLNDAETVAVTLGFQKKDVSA